MNGEASNRSAASLHRVWGCRIIANHSPARVPTMGHLFVDQPLSSWWRPGAGVRACRSFVNRSLD
jgi:hypothetical protein